MAYITIIITLLHIIQRAYPLLVYNSLIRKKVRFIPIKSNLVTWYQCGPTVYAESHMGHARTYVSLDILRRIMKYYLGYNVIVCQNITDIDDKIIIRSSEKNIPFRDLALKYERDFVGDMVDLGVQRPDITTRVSEYISEIILYIQVLINKKIAYLSNGSVYFDTESFEKCGFTYGKLQPEQIGNTDLLNEGEGSLRSNEEKKNMRDFVVWKKSKSHENGIVEPSWESPWGYGRPGWHIECSVMSNSAMKVLNDGYLDIHAGGIDLKFPHHENEIAQSEGYTGHNQWTNYWFHTGHLNIRGSKMSKSLKNFTTIKEVLKSYTSRQIRFCFLMHKYNEPMDYDTNVMFQAIDVEKRVSEFFHSVKSLLRKDKFDKEFIGKEENRLLDFFEKSKVKVRYSMLDDFDTPKVVSLLLDLIKACNIYLHAVDTTSACIIFSTASYIDYILSIFGLGEYLPGQSPDLNIRSQSSNENVMSPILDVLATFRQRVRVAAMSNNSTKILEAADELRDVFLPTFGIRMEDVGSGENMETIWKFDDPEVLKKEKSFHEEIMGLKVARKEALLRKESEKAELAKISPVEFFKREEGIYSQFDLEGVPSHDKDGKPLSKSRLKQLKKEMNNHVQLYKSVIDKTIRF